MSEEKKTKTDDPAWPVYDGPIKPKLAFLIADGEAIAEIVFDEEDGPMSEIELGKRFKLEALHSAFDEMVALQATSASLEILRDRQTDGDQVRKYSILAADSNEMLADAITRCHEILSIEVNRALAETRDIAIKGFGETAR